MNGIEIKSLRSRLGLTQEALAPIVGVSTQTINRWERGIHKPSRLAIEKMKSLEIQVKDDAK